MTSIAKTLSKNLASRRGSVRGVLFDLDGTLVDTEHLSPLVWNVVLKEAGVTDKNDLLACTTALQGFELRGANAKVCAERLVQCFPATAAINSEYTDPNFLAKRKRAMAVEMVVRGDIDLAPLWFTGVADSIRRLEREVGHYAVGLCTSNLGKVALETIRAGGLADSFLGGRTAQEDVLDPSTGLPNIKPKPDPYLLAMMKMGIPAGSVVAVEDSVVGVRAAVGAGVGTVLGVLNRNVDCRSLEFEGEIDEEKKAEADEVEAEAEAALLDAGANAVFSTTVGAIEWCISNASSVALMEERERVVRRYFEGVNRKDPQMMAGCFADTVELRDMCGPSRGALRSAKSADMATRCMEFLAAHPDCRVEFESPPTCDRHGDWVWCHWVESGTWTGESCGIAPKGTPLDVGGHTRFLLRAQDDGSQRIVKQVVYRTFSEWELSL